MPKQWLSNHKHYVTQQYCASIIVQSNALYISWAIKARVATILASLPLQTQCINYNMCSLWQLWIVVCSNGCWGSWVLTGYKLSLELLLQEAHSDSSQILPIIWKHIFLSPFSSLPSLVSLTFHSHILPWKRPSGLIIKREYNYIGRYIHSSS